MKINRLGLLFALAILLFAACAPTSPADESLVMGAFPRNAHGYADITVEQLAELLEGQDVTMVNVHVPYEGEIPQTDLFVPFDEIGDHLSELPGQDAPIVLYCRSGSMSTSAAAELALLGYTNVAEVDGGMGAWEAAGYTLLDSSMSSTVEPTPGSTPTPDEPVAPPTAVPPTLTTAPPVLGVQTPADVQRITVEEARQLVESGAALLYDTRSAAEYRTRHAAGATSFPDTDAAARHGELPTDQVIIFYCT